MYESMGILQSGTSDKGEIVIIMGDSEYPKRFFPAKKSMIMDDIGAHIGSFSLYFNKIMEEFSPKIYSIEPSKNNFEMLKNNIELNDCREIKPFNCAIGGKDGIAYIDLNNDFDAFRIGATTDFKSSNIEECQVLSLQSFAALAGVDSIDLLKMDCEGGEFDIFLNSLDFILKKISYLFIEVHEISGGMPILKFKSFLEQHNLVVDAVILGRTFFVRNLNIT
jgi:FkbM family methyltransferase